MSTTKKESIKKKKRTATERVENKRRIAEAKGRAARWAEQRRSQRNQATTTATAIQVPRAQTVLPPENSVLQDLKTRRTELLKELTGLDTAIAVIHNTYAR